MNLGGGVKKKIPLWIKLGIIGAFYGILGSILFKYGLLGVPVVGYFALPVSFFTSLIIGMVSIQNEMLAWVFLIFYNLILFFLIGVLIGYIIERFKKYEK